MAVLVEPEPDSDHPGDHARVVSVRDGCVTLAWEAGAGDAEGGTLLKGDVPDLADPATLGCLLALVREAHGEPDLYCSRQTGPGWGVYLEAEEIALADTEVEALVAALESAP